MAYKRSDKAFELALYHVVLTDTDMGVNSVLKGGE